MPTVSFPTPKVHANYLLPAAGWHSTDLINAHNLTHNQYTTLYIPLHVYALSVIWNAVTVTSHATTASTGTETVESVPHKAYFKASGDKVCLKIRYNGTSSSLL
jgi:hypothetical protein